MVSKPESSRDAVLRVMQDGIVRTDAEIVAVSGLSHSKATGARAALWEAGLVERIEKDESHDRFRWRLCPPERRQDAQRAFRDSSERRTRGRLRQCSPEERASIVIDLLADDRVNDALLAQLERNRAWRRARARANDLHGEREAERRARRSELRRAERDADADLEYLTQLNHLRELMDSLFVMRRFVEAEEQRRRDGESLRIKPSSWMALAKNVREVLEVAQVLFRDVARLLDQPMDSCPLCGDRLHDAAIHLGEGYVDAEVVEDLGEEPATIET
jgi:hypothetical protein